MVTLVLKKLYIDKLDDMTNKYNNTYYSTIKMKPVYVKSNTYINSSKEVNDKDHKFEVGDHARLSKQKYFRRKLRSKLVWRTFGDYKT